MVGMERYPIDLSFTPTGREGDDEPKTQTEYEESIIDDQAARVGAWLWEYVTIDGVRYAVFVR